MGRGNVRLVTWEGEKTLTFTVTDALLSPVGFAILSGAGLFKGATTERVHVHMAHYATVAKTGESGSEKYIIDLTEYAGTDKVLKDAPFFVLTAENGSIVGDVIKNVVVTSTETSSGSGKYTTSVEISRDGANYEGSQVFVDYYIEKSAAKVSELQIDAENFAGNYYVEAETLFRRESDGVDMPAIITLPNVKIQSNFTFSMASTGDPSTFDFTMDALPGLRLCGSALKIA